MNKIIKLFFILSLFSTGCGDNILKDMSGKSSQEAYVTDAIKALDAKDYDGAITILTTKLNSDYMVENKVRRLTAEAYAGKCGLDTVTYLTSLGSASSTAIFRIMLAPVVGVAVVPNYCALATAKMVEIGNATTRTTSDNTFLTILNMLRMGANIQAALDRTPTNGDGTIDKSPCLLADMTDAQIDEVILGLGYVIENITYVSSSLIGGSSTTALTTLTATCAAAGITCTITDPTLITAPVRDVFRDLLNTSEYGVGSVVTGGNPIAIGLACP